MVDRLLLAYDGSEPADDAFEYVLERFPDADVTALYVVEIPDTDVVVFEGPELRPPLSEKAREGAEEVLEPVERVARERDRTIETEIDRGKPDRRIVHRAEEDEYDLLVVGSHGRRGPSRVLLGSVAEAVVRRSPIPVLVVR